MRYRTGGSESARRAPACDDDRRGDRRPASARSTSLAAASEPVIASQITALSQIRDVKNAQRWAAWQPVLPNLVPVDHRQPEPRGVLAIGHEATTAGVAHDGRAVLGCDAVIRRKSRARSGGGTRLRWWWRASPRRSPSARCCCRCPWRPSPVSAPGWWMRCSPRRQPCA